MADVFISYNRSQRLQVSVIAERLRELGLSVWFDASLAPGARFDEEINREVRNAKAVLVCWTADAIASTWVRAEAMIGHERNVLAAVFLGPTELMPPFNLVQAEDLIGWRGDTSHPAWIRLVDRLLKLVQLPAHLVTPQITFAFEPKNRFNRMPPPRIGERWAEIATFRAGKQTFPPWTNDESYLNAIEWASLDDAIITAGQSNGLLCWTDGGAAITRMKIKGPRFYVGSIAVTQNRGSRLMATAGHGPLCIWRIPSYKPVFQHEFTDREYVTALSWQPGSDYGSEPTLLAASVSLEDRYREGPKGMICLWDVHTGIKKWSHPCHVSYRLHWSPSGNHLAAPEFYGYGFEIFQLSGEQLSFKTCDDDGPNNIYLTRAGFAWHPSGRYFATGISDREIGIYDLASLNRVRTLILDAAHRSELSSVTSVQWGPDGRFITASTGVGTTVVFHVDRGEPQTAMYGTEVEPNDLAFSPDGQRFATRGKDGLRLWDPTRGEEIATIPKAGNRIMQIRWHPDSQRIMFAHDNGRVKIARLEF